jgi:hypothetical protein
MEEPQVRSRNEMDSYVSPTPSRVLAVFEEIAKNTTVIVAAVLATAHALQPPRPARVCATPEVAFLVFFLIPLGILLFGILVHDVVACRSELRSTRRRLWAAFRLAIGVPSLIGLGWFAQQTPRELTHPRQLTPSGSSSTEIRGRFVSAPR